MLDFKSAFELPVYEVESTIQMGRSIILCFYVI